MKNIKTEISELSKIFFEKIQTILDENETKERLVENLNTELDFKNSRLESQVEVLEKQKQRLHYANVLFKTFMDNAPFLAWIKDEKFEYVYVNQRFYEDISKTTEVQGKNDFELFNKKIATQLRKNDTKVIEHNELIEITENVPQEDGAYQFTQTFKFPIQYSKDKAYIAGLAIDITKSKLQEKFIKELESKNAQLARQEEELIQFNEEMRNSRDALEKVVGELEERNQELESKNAQLAQQEEELMQFNEEMRTSRDALEKVVGELEERNEELDHFVYKVSHDVRAPLATAMGIMEVIENLESIEEIKKYALLGKSRLKHLDGFLKGLLDFSRTQRMESKEEDIVLLKLVSECLDEQKYQIGYDKIKRVVDISEQYTLRSQKILLKIVLSNLISNAIKYYDKYKTANYVNISLKHTEEHHRITIQDNGIGIDKSYLTKIFDIFYRANQDVKGTGLGLYIARKSIDKLKGKIEVSSKLGSGTRFSVVLPKKT